MPSKPNIVTASRNKSATGSDKVGHCLSTNCSFSIVEMEKEGRVSNRIIALNVKRYTDFSNKTEKANG